MNFKQFALGLALLLPTMAYSPDASAGDEYQSCAHKKDDKKRAKCNKNHAKYLKKNQSKTEAFKPSALSDKLADYDADDKNWFASDDWYFGSLKIGVESVDSLTAEVDRAVAAVKTARYVGYLHKNGQQEEAVKLAGIVLPELINLKDIVPTLKEKVAAVQADVPNIAKENPKAALQAPKILGATLTNIGKLPADLGGAVKAVTPLAKGSAGAAKDMAGDAMKKKAGGK